MSTTLTALGQSGFVLAAGERRIVFDPYLSNSVEESGGHPPGMWQRQFPPPMTPSDLRADAALISHVHNDHCDRVTITALAAANPSCVFCGPYPVRQQLAAWELSERVRPVALNEWSLLGDATIMAVPAAHETFEPDASGEPAFFGFLVRAGGVTLYHAGDTLAWPGLVEQLRPHCIDVALLPVNGRDQARSRAGIIGNMTAEEAMRLAAAIGVRMVVPIHNDLFAVNRTPWAEVSEAARQLPSTCALLRISAGERLVLESQVR